MNGSRGIRVDPDWITGYAGTVARAGDELAAAVRAIEGAPLTGTSFGDLGRAAGAPGAYTKASGMLQQQLSRAAAALGAAAGGLRTVAGAHSGVDADHAATIRRAQQG